jgi:IS30 family transposase
MTITEKERAKELYDLGISQTEIGRQLGYSYSTIHRFLTQEKIDPMIG